MPNNYPDEHKRRGRIDALLKALHFNFEDLTELAKQATELARASGAKSGRARARRVRAGKKR